MSSAEPSGPTRGQFRFAVVLTIVTAIIIYLALRAVPGPQRPTLRPVPSSTSLSAGNS